MSRAQTREARSSAPRWTSSPRAADLKVPAALAVDSVRYSITDAEAGGSGPNAWPPVLAGAFSVVWEWENRELTSELIEYHSARGTFSADSRQAEVIGFSRVTTAAAPISDVDELAPVAAGPPAQSGRSLTRLGPLPPMRMDPTGGPVLERYRKLALERYGRTSRPTSRLVDVALTLVLRFADVGVATYASLRVVGRPDVPSPGSSKSRSCWRHWRSSPAHCPNRIRGRRSRTPSAGHSPMAPSRRSRAS